jgi:hypothetical protein
MGMRKKKYYSLTGLSNIESAYTPAFSSAPTSYPFSVATGCYTDPDTIIYSNMPNLNIGASVYYFPDLTSPFNAIFSTFAWPVSQENIGVSSNINGLITSTTTTIGGCD